MNDRVRGALSLRTRILLVLLAALLPLGAVGLWVASTAERSGEALLRTRLRESLMDVAAAVGVNWVQYRSDLLDLAGTDAARLALSGTRPLPSPRSRARPDPDADGSGEALWSAWARLDGVAEAVTFRDAGGRLLGTLARGGTGGPSGSAQPTGLPGAAPAALLAVSLDLRRGASGTRIGVLDARVRLASLLADATWWARVGGSVLGAFDPRTGTPLLQGPIEPELLARREFTWEGERWLAVHHDLREPPLRLALAAPVTPFQEPFRRAARHGTAALLVALIGAALLATLLTRRTTRSLAELARAADAVSGGDLDRRVPASGPDELRRLAGAFNTMTENLRRTLAELSRRRSLAAVGEFAASLAHEIRNPLTAVRLDLQRTLRGDAVDARTRALVGRALGELDKLEGTVSTALELARSGRVRLGSMDLREPLRAAVREESPAYVARQARLEVPDLPRPLPVRGDVGALERLFRNLLANAADAVAAGGTTRITVEEMPSAITVSIEDDGPGIAPHVLERIQEPLFSTKPSGTGLGLPVARRIAQAHGAELHVDSVPARGTSVRVEFPRHPLVRPRSGKGGDPWPGEGVTTPDAGA